MGLAALGVSCSSTRASSVPGPADAQPADAPASIDQAGPAGDAGAPDRNSPDAASDGICSGVCPANAPATGPCDCVSFCRYYECGGRGRVEAICDGAHWSVTSQPCGEAPCLGPNPCPAGKICVETQSGTVLRECVDNPCGAGPVRCACAALVCRIGACMDQGQFGGADVVCAPKDPRPVP